MKRKILNSVLAITLVFSSATPLYAQKAQPDRLAGRSLPGSLASLKLETPATLQGLSRAALDSRLAGATGAKKVIVRLSADSSAAAFVKGADTARAKQNAKAQQDGFVATARTLDPNARLVARVQAVLNAVFLELDASVLPAFGPRSQSGSYCTCRPL